MDAAVSRGSAYRQRTGQIGHLVRISGTLHRIELLPFSDARRLYRPRSIDLASTLLMMFYSSTQTSLL